jgi:hypothetical protein
MDRAAGTTCGRESNRDGLTDVVLQELARAISRLKYGSITVKVHDGKVTQMEIAEKKRFDESAGFEKGDGI